MSGWITENLGTILVGAAVAGLTGAAVWGLIRSRSKGGGCSCGCQGCPEKDRCGKE